MIEYIDIYNYWKSHPNYWICIENKEKADSDIYNKFYYIIQDNLDKPINIDINNNDSLKSFIGYIILLDQFHRHFNRYLKLGDTKILEYRIIAVELLDKMNINFFLKLDEEELYFCLMPYKHLENYQKCIDVCLEWCNYHNKKIKDCDIISKFYNDTYAKYYTIENIKSNINTVHIYNSYNPDKICDYYPDKYLSEYWLNTIFTELLYNPLKNWYEQIKQNMTNRQIIVSLSGGVDSMVILCLLKNLNISIIATHIIYGNREVSNEEYSFISTYCKKLSVPLYSYRIEFLKRNNIERSFYEKMTRDIRFNVYKSIDNNDKPIIVLGHIKDDVIENIWTNISKCQHIYNLGKMAYSEIQENVQIERPFLYTDKKDIYKLSEELSIPYLKNTTPSWSNRGKFREKFYIATHEQFGHCVDKNILMFANIIKSQNQMIENILYKPILETYNNYKLDITLAIKSNLDLVGWIYIIENLCHNYAKIAKPSMRSIEQFVKRFKSSNNKEKSQLYQMKYNYQFLITNNITTTTLEIILL